MNFSEIFTKPYMSFLFDGLLVTLEVAFFSIILSFMLGIILGTVRYTAIPFISHIATLYIEVIRNLPLLLIIFFGYFGLRELGREIPITESVIISMTIFTSALVAEIVRSGLNSVDKGQIEAARSQGFTYLQTLRLIVLPQALKRMLPPLVSQFVSLIKDTSLAISISLPELTHNAQIIYNRHFDLAIPLLIFLAFIYFIINYSLSLTSRLLEKKWAR